MEEFAEPKCFTPEPFQRSVKNLLTAR